MKQIPIEIFNFCWPGQTKIGGERGNRVRESHETQEGEADDEEDERRLKQVMNEEESRWMKMNEDEWRRAKMNEYEADN